MVRKLLPLAFLFLFITSCETDNIDYKAKDKTTIEKYLADHNLTAQHTASGLYYIIDKPGGANHPTTNSQIAIKYKGYLTDSTVFDNSEVTPVYFELKKLIAGMQEGIQLIGVNGKIHLYIPSDLGYGSKEQNKIPAHSVLIFDVELVEFF